MDLSVSPTTAGVQQRHIPKNASNDEQLRQVAQDLEAAFLSEMLKHTGLGETPDSFGGGVGEDQFSSLLRDAQAKEMSAKGGIGLAESIFNSLKEKSDV